MKRILFFVGVFLFLSAGLVHAESNQFIAVNKASNKLALYEDGRLINIFDVATGATAQATPEGKYTVSVKWKCPVYYKGKNGPCEENNPLGPRWLGLSVPGTAGYTYGIHGNSSPWTIGTYASGGCVRMYNWQITQIFDIVKTDTPVVIVRSKKTFDEIAAENKYHVKKPEKMNEVITIFGATDAYYGAHRGLPAEKKFTKDSEEVKVVGKVDDWLRVEASDKKSYWINTDNYVFGKVNKEFKYIGMKDGKDIYGTPYQNSNKVELARPFVFYSSLSVNNWYYVDYTNNRKGWVKASDVEIVTKKEWELQQEMKKQVNEVVEGIKDLENKNSEYWKNVINLFI